MVQYGPINLEPPVGAKRVRGEQFVLENMNLENINVVISSHGEFGEST